jgi:hypothetical protein
VISDARPSGTTIEITSDDGHRPVPRIARSIASHIRPRPSAEGRFDGRSTDGVWTFEQRGGSFRPQPAGHSGNFLACQAAVELAHAQLNAVSAGPRLPGCET